jgi:lipoprotein NlpI
METASNDSTALRMFSSPSERDYSVRPHDISAVLRCITGFLLLVISSAFASDPPFPKEERARMLTDFRAQLAALNQEIEKAPREVPLYSQRGDRHLFLGQFKEAVTDFEKMIALDAAQDTPHWRLGIAYYFAGEFAKSARQFEKYHSYDGRDRENGLWKFLGDVRVLGLAPARRAMLVYTRFDREPFPALYTLFAGANTTAAFFAEIKHRNLADDPRVMFFANYYGGLNEHILGETDEALRLLHKAVASPWERSAEGGPVYMWQVARLHYEHLLAGTVQKGRGP